MVRSINVGVQKIDNTIFETYEMVIVAFSMTDQTNRVKCMLTMTYVGYYGNKQAPAEKEGCLPSSGTMT